MKTPRLVLALLCAVQISAFADAAGDAKAKKINDLYQTGIVALKAGQRKTARQAFLGVLELQPKNGNVRYQLAHLDKNYDRVMEAKRKQQFGNTRLEQVYFDEATVPEALAALDRMATEASDKTFSPNFVVQDPDGIFADKRITFQLRNVPLSTALEYVLKNAKGNARYDEHATVIIPRPGQAKPDTKNEKDEEEEVEN